MRSLFFSPVRKGLVFLVAFVLFAAWSVVVCAEGPSVINVNPQGTVTNHDVSITLDTEDLAKCRYSKSNIAYSDMTGIFDTPDGLYHSAALGTLTDGSYTYFVRCKDFDGNVNDSSKQVKFKVGNITSPDGGETSSGGPVISGMGPTGTISTSYNVLTVTTDKEAACRYSSFNKAFDAMTLTFSSSNKLYHTAPVALSSYGYYTYYVRCRDTDGNVNATAATISFNYPRPYVPYVAPVTPVTPKDTTAPVISSLEPTGDVTTETTKISCSTDEAATCKYDTTDVAYDTMANAMDADAAKTGHSKEVTLTAAGSVTYYVRCTDKAGNKNDSSSQISFNYAPPKKDGPVISNLQPTGVIYQKNVALIAQTDKAAECRYATTDVDFDSMLDSFTTSDGQLQQATVTLNDYADYTYYVRCRDKDGNVDAASAQITFTYQNPNPATTENPDGTAPATTEPATPITCSEYTMGEKNGECDKTVDCLCDPDCSGKDADPDCANITTGGGGNNWIVVVLIGLVLIIVIILVIVIMKRRGGEEETVELP